MKWNSKEINEQRHMKTGHLHFNPPISVKTMRKWFEGAMKIVKELNANIPFRSGHDDEEEPSQMLIVLEDLYKQKTSFDSY
jgi:hypothetical protein